MRIRSLSRANWCWREPIRHTAHAAFILRTPLAKIRLLGEALRNLNGEGHIGYVWVTQKQMERCGAIEEDCEGLVNYVLLDRRGRGGGVFP